MFAHENFNVHTYVVAQLSILKAENFNLNKATRVGQMKNIAHLRGLAKKVCSRQQLICPFVDNATIQASIDLMNSLTSQTVLGHLDQNFSKITIMLVCSRNMASLKNFK